MTQLNVAVIVLAAGKGSRMESEIPKVLHVLAGKSMLAHVLDSASSLEPEHLVLVIGPDMSSVAEVASEAAIVIQHTPLGTGHAVKQAQEKLNDFKGDILVLFGDSPLITADTIQRLVAARHDGTNPAVVVCGFNSADPKTYGRLITNEVGELESIIEFHDANSDQREITLCNGGVMVVDGEILFEFLSQISADNNKGEYYLTDIVALARKNGRVCRVFTCKEEEVSGINTRVQLAEAESIMQGRLRERAMASGVSMIDPDSVFLCSDTLFGRDVILEPNIFFGPGVSIGERCRIRAFSHIEGTDVASDSTIGPYARLRPGSEVGSGVQIGNFVEIKAASLETGVKVNHLTYIGDARVGAYANVGAGTITCNYDGISKHRTDIGKGAFIGSNSSLIAPVTIGDGAIIGAGSAINRDVPSGALAVTRSKQAEKGGWARRFFGLRKS